MGPVPESRPYTWPAKLVPVKPMPAIGLRGQTTRAGHKLGRPNLGDRRRGLLVVFAGPLVYGQLDHGGDGQLGGFDNRILDMGGEFLGELQKGRLD